MPSLAKLRRWAEAEGYQIRPRSRSRNGLYWLTDATGRDLADPRGETAEGIWTRFFDLCMASLVEDQPPSESDAEGGLDG